MKRPRGWRSLHFCLIAIVLTVLIFCNGQALVAQETGGGGENLAPSAPTTIFDVNPSSSEQETLPTNDEIAPKLAPVVLDGNVLFDVAGFGELTAEERAAQFSQVLAAGAQQQNLPPVNIREGQGTTTITLNGDDFITVTKADAIQNLRSPERQASIWANIIQEALSEAQAKRNPKVRRRSIILSIGLLVLTGIVFWRLGHWQHQLSPHPFNQLKELIRGQVQRDEIPIKLRQVGIAVCLWVFRYGAWMGIIFYISQLFPATQKIGYMLTRGIIRSFIAPIFPLGDRQYSLVNLVILGAGFLALVVSASVLTNLLKTRILQFAGISTGSQQAIATLTRYTLIGLGTIVILQLWGLDLSSLTLFASALSVGIGFGLQNIARDFGSGLVLLFERPVQVGDFVEVGDYTGTVDRIGSRSTTIKTLDQISVIVPNSYFLENQVINWSHDNPLSRIAIPVGVAYSSDPELVKKLLLQAATDYESVRSIPPPQVLFLGFGDSALRFQLLVWIIEPNRQPIIKSDLYFNVLALLRKHHVEIPFPQRDLHIRSGSVTNGHHHEGMELESELERDRPLTG